jgi:Ca2+-binding EF-hand superfamily protein
MLAKTSERQMHLLRWFLTLSWLLLIISLFYDPFTPWLTQPENAWSPFQSGLACITVQDKCLKTDPYPLGSTIFWQLVIPTAILIIFIGGHVFWRRICPLSFLSQIPRALGWQRHSKKVDKKTGKTRYELVKVDKNSWLYRHHLYLQMGFFYLGITSRILFLNSERLLLGIVLFAIIVAAILVGYLYAGKSWRQYFCPMAPVQKIYGEPRGLLNSIAHEGDRQLITQSMCRATTAAGKEQSACVACITPCIDIDAERTYWESLQQPAQQWLYYGYFGLAIGYFLSYYLYAGNWEYYRSGIWSHEENVLGSLLNPGWYIFGKFIGIPKLITVPLTIGLSGLVAYYLGRKAEHIYKTFLLRQHKLVSEELIRHRLFKLTTFLILNIFFILTRENFVRFLPTPIGYLFPAFVAACSGIWLQRTWPRNSHIYEREGLASRLRKQLQKLNLNVAEFLENRSLEDLNADEVYVLAKVLPGFDQEKRLQAYKGIVKESMGDDYVNVTNAQQMFQDIRRELNISEEEHELILTEIEVENPKLFKVHQQKNREDWIRQESYHQALTDTLIKSSENHPHQGIILDLFDVMVGKKPFEYLNEILGKLSPEELKEVQKIRDKYAVTAEEEEEILTQETPRKLWQTMAYTLGIVERLEAITEGNFETSSSSGLSTLSSEEQAFYEQTFQKFDKDRDQSLSVVELRALLRSVGRTYSQEKVQEVMDKITGISASSSLNFSQFTQLIQENLSNSSEETWRRRFSFLDSQEVGELSYEDLRVCLRDLNNGLTDSEIEQMLQLADTDRDGKISAEEFAQVFTQVRV